MANNYQKRKEQARQEAIEWQHEFADDKYSWAQIHAYQEYFSIIGKRYGLLKEFRENCIV